MESYTKTVEEVLQDVQSSKQGLSKQEASLRLKKEGFNQLQSAEKITLGNRILKQITDPMILVLLGAAFLSGITSYVSHESFVDVFIILFVVMVNTILGVYQESKAEKAIDALKQMNQASVKVYRDQEISSIPSTQIVRGDVIRLEAGDVIPADGRIIECALFKVEESALTGESEPVDKQVEPILNQNNLSLGDQKNQVFMGSSVVYGRAKVVVEKTGMATQIGKIADAILNIKEELTPLQIKLNQLSKKLSLGVIGICVFIFVFSLIKGQDYSIHSFISTFMLAISLAVAALPEGLVAVVTVQLAIGVTKMAKQQAIIRKLTAVETLGCTEVICSDKTGTLTQNKMTVVKHYGDQELLAKIMSLCNDVEINQDGQLQGEPTELALATFGQKYYDRNSLIQKFPRVNELPFDSNRKMMSTLHQENKNLVQYTKGAPDVLLAHCTMYLHEGKVEKIDETIKEKILFENKQMADEALRVLAGAYRKSKGELCEDDLIFVGLCGMIDPVREEVKEAIQACKNAGIKPIMITGDHLDTAIAIGKSLDIIDFGDQAITGNQLDLLDDQTLYKQIQKYGVYARVQPNHKVRIVDAWQHLGKVVAMSGDGVNDAPSIIRADSGVGMGITGTDVTKNVADMVLADDNFATIVYAVKEGRRIYDNILKAIQFLISSNISEVIAIFVASVFGFTILQPVHILWINLLTDTFPALALGMEEAGNEIMERKPRPKNEDVFANGLFKEIVFQGTVIALITLMAYFVGHFIETGKFEIANSADGMTMAFLTLSMTELFHCFNMRSRTKSIFKIKKQNGYLWLSLLGSLLATLSVIYLPFLSQVFGFESISIFEFMIAILMSALIIPIVEIEKRIRNRKLHR